MPDKPAPEETAGPNFARRGTPVDEPPGIYGNQGRPAGEVPPPVPDWPPGANPPGTNPPKGAGVSGDQPIPGSVPGMGADQYPAKEPAPATKKP